MNSHVWKYQTDELSKSFRIITFDLRGHGKSGYTRDEGRGTIFDACVQDLKDLIDSLAIERFTLVGWSMASFIIARYYFKYPDDIEKLIFISGTPKFASEKGYPYGQPMTMVKRLEQNLKRDYKNYIREFCERLFISGEGIDRNRLTEIKEMMFNEDFPPKSEITLQTLDFLTNDDIRDNLKGIKVPTLIVHGDIDKICPVSAGKYMTRGIPNSKMVILEGVGHAPFLTLPERVNKEIKDFCYD